MMPPTTLPSRAWTDEKRSPASAIAVSQRVWSQVRWDTLMTRCAARVGGHPRDVITSPTHRCDYQRKIEKGWVRRSGAWQAGHVANLPLMMSRPHTHTHRLLVVGMLQRDTEWRELTAAALSSSSLSSLSSSVFLVQWHSTLRYRYYRHRRQIQ